MNESVRSPVTLFRAGLGTGILALAFTSALLQRAQSGPAWEVPQSVMRLLTLGPVLQVVLAIVAAGAFACVQPKSAVSTPSWFAALAFLVASALGTVVVLFAEPTQWPAQHPLLSRLVSSLSLPVALASGLSFWLVGFRSIPKSSFRSGLRALLMVLGSTIAVGAFVAAALLALG